MSCLSKFFNDQNKKKNKLCPYLNSTKLSGASKLSNTLQNYYILLVRIRNF